MGLKAFVTGGSGFVGMNLIHQLVGQGWEIAAMVRTNSPLEDIEGLGVNLVEGDITDAESVRQAMPLEVDCVFHVAAKPGVWGKYSDYYNTNTIGTQNIVDACLKHNVKRLIHTSSPSVVHSGGDVEGIEIGFRLVEHGPRACWCAECGSKELRQR